MKRYPVKEVTCRCGNVFETDRERDWCMKCGHPVYYKKSDQLFNKAAHIYIFSSIVIIFISMGFLIYKILDITTQ